MEKINDSTLYRKTIKPFILLEFESEKKHIDFFY